MPEDTPAYANRPQPTQARTVRRVFLARSESPAASVIVRTAIDHLRRQGYEVVSAYDISKFDFPTAMSQRREELRRLIDCDALAVMAGNSLDERLGDVRVRMALELGMSVLQLNLVESLQDTRRPEPEPRPIEPVSPFLCSSTNC